MNAFGWWYRVGGASVDGGMMWMRGYIRKEIYMQRWEQGQLSLHGAGIKS